MKSQASNLASAFKFGLPDLTVNFGFKFAPSPDDSVLNQGGPEGGELDAPIPDPDS